MAILKKSQPLNAKPFFKKKGPVGCLIIHGFTASPPEMEPLGDYLAERNITVSGIMLPGHGTTPEDMIKTTWHDWTAAAEQGLLDLKSKCDEVFIAGLSMGGALTLYLASRHKIAGAASLAGAVIIKDWRVTYLAPVMKHFVSFFPKSGTHMVDQTLEHYHVSYNYNPVPCVLSLVELTGIVRKSLPNITCPMLVMHSHNDKMLVDENAQLIYDHIASEKKELVWLEKSSHIITLDIEREIVFEKVYELIKRESAIL